MPKYYDAQSMMDAAEKDTTSSLKIQQDKKMQSPKSGMKKDGTMPPGPRSGQIPYMDHAPKDPSPHGDLGVMSQKEMNALFPHKIHGGTDYVSSKHLPMGKVRTAADYGVMAPRIDACSTVYPEHDLSSYQGMKAGGKVATQRRGVKARIPMTEGGHEGYRSV